jgi:hypothetical protein
VKKSSRFCALVRRPKSLSFNVALYSLELVSGTTYGTSLTKMD